MLLCTYFNADNIAAPFFGNKPVLGKLLLNAVGISSVLIDFIYRNNYADACRLGMVDCFDRLRHDSVICGNNKDCNIRYLSAARTHRSKRFVTGRVEKCNLTAVDVYHIRTDMLRDSARFTCGYVC